MGSFFSAFLAGWVQSRVPTGLEIDKQVLNIDGFLSIFRWLGVCFGFGVLGNWIMRIYASARVAGKQCYLSTRQAVWRENMKRKIDLFLELLRRWDKFKIQVDRWV